MKNFYICNREDFLSHHHQFNGGHFIDLADGKILLCTETRNEAFHERWISQPHIQEIPHPLSGENLSQHHVDALKDHIPGVSTSDSAWTLAKRVSKINKLMHLK